MTYFELLDNKAGNFLGNFHSLAEAVAFARDYLPDSALADLQILQDDGDRVMVALNADQLRHLLTASETLPIFQVPTMPQPYSISSYVLGPIRFSGPGFSALLPGFPRSPRVETSSAPTRVDVHETPERSATLPTRSRGPVISEWREAV